MKGIINEFLQQIQPAYPEKLSVEYKREGDNAIPLKMAEKYSEDIPLEMSKGETIVLKSKEESQNESTQEMNRQEWF